jgi:hypothetical protein
MISINISNSNVRSTNISNYLCSIATVQDMPVFEVPKMICVNIRNICIRVLNICTMQEMVLLDVRKETSFCKFVL